MDGQPASLLRCWPRPFRTTDPPSRAPRPEQSRDSGVAWHGGGPWCPLACCWGLACVRRGAAWAPSWVSRLLVTLSPSVVGRPACPAFPGLLEAAALPAAPGCSPAEGACLGPCRLPCACRWRGPAWPCRGVHASVGGAGAVASRVLSGGARQAWCCCFKQREARGAAHRISAPQALGWVSPEWTKPGSWEVSGVGLHLAVLGVLWLS